jgi:hypothetical protein
VSNGLFTVTLDFGPGIFTGPNYWMALALHPEHSTNGFTGLTPLQFLASTPQSVYALSAGTAAFANAVATNAVLTVQSLNVGQGNTQSGVDTIIAGGSNNAATAACAVVAGGNNNTAGHPVVGPGSPVRPAILRCLVQGRRRRRHQHQRRLCRQRHHRPARGRRRDDRRPLFTQPTGSLFFRLANP